ncbi:MAG: hypothetical protein ACD_38C00179G0001 [uncultured bacterium]|uniref:Uncharacterized protein n=1 Tax=Candidatus Daviesbacteria bacterium GW2011_GWC2_40_12 TaxID=1618431 RepID=A0A0G0QPR3_9BACT|nr:MAG: hypothetical protein ACD_38C00179G0001 [uncultured bacterium]KKQ82642.1 MAG: hypothetical protein UT04_C0053G0003 [Candidatus Daviesbacteria bacterium GW2011_GWF2_38_7]KKR16784.1 MAG: hypothetical protein UT45_C0004G0115 [Candidatus Daviesbacteria bacterium GW2011_GWA2_39_33]KKR42434.1 MAG: hypothetical protein UT77_C0002G0087 [Candidatus Daviesbacteria bacterium GW2011_GWC2_40_12]OGE22347.1 MAG: hypothetical protein A2778_00685 [Candidatus Daviesbacteria bacterium RIFCSPHIGHO2_01_FULL_
MRLKTAVLLTFSAFVIITSPVFAVNPSAEKTIDIKKRLDDRLEKLDKRVASKEAIAAEKIENIKERIASKEAILRLKLEKFKNQEKAQIAQRVNANLNIINQNQIEKMLIHLSTMSTILDRLEARVTGNTPDIKDPAKAKEAIAAAREAISSASAAVKDQKENDYTIQISSESKIKADAKKQRDQLHKDLTAIRKRVIDAKQAVSNAIRVAKSGSESSKEGTPSGQQ